MATMKLAERFWSKVDKRGLDECWLWLAGINSEGYGQFWAGDRQAKPHRIAYELLVGPIPDGLQIDHLCRNRRCVNPTHLEPVTQRENLLRGETSLAAKSAAKTHCPQGHPYDLENTYVNPRGWRECRACRRERNGGRPTRSRSGAVSSQQQPPHKNYRLCDSPPSESELL